MWGVEDDVVHDTILPAKFCHSNGKFAVSSTTDCTKTLITHGTHGMSALCNSIDDDYVNSAVGMQACMAAFPMEGALEAQLENDTTGLQGPCADLGIGLGLDVDGEDHDDMLTQMMMDADDLRDIIADKQNEIEVLQEKLREKDAEVTAILALKAEAEDQLKNVLRQREKDLQERNKGKSEAKLGTKRYHPYPKTVTKGERAATLKLYTLSNSNKTAKVRATAIKAGNDKRRLGKVKKEDQRCDHGKRKDSCGRCNRRLSCEHKARRRDCGVCNPSSHCEHRGRFNEPMFRKSCRICSSHFFCDQGCRDTWGQSMRRDKCPHKQSKQRLSTKRLAAPADPEEFKVDSIP